MERRRVHQKKSKRISSQTYANGHPEVSPCTNRQETNNECPRFPNRIAGKPELVSSNTALPDQTQKTTMHHNSTRHKHIIKRTERLRIQTILDAPLHLALIPKSVASTNKYWTPGATYLDPTNLEKRLGSSTRAQTPRISNQQAHDATDNKQFPI
jgi:hypothetical protein